MMKCKTEGCQAWAIGGLQVCALHCVGLRGIHLPSPEQVALPEGLLPMQRPRPSIEEVSLKVMDSVE